MSETVKVWDERIGAYRHLQKSITQEKWFKNATHLHVEEAETKIEQIRKDGEDVKQPKDQEPENTKNHESSNETHQEGQEDGEGEEKVTHWLDGLKKQEALELLDEEGIKESGDERKNKQQIIEKLKEHYGG